MSCIEYSLTSEFVIEIWCFVFPGTSSPSRLLESKNIQAQRIFLNAGLGKRRLHLCGKFKIIINRMDCAPSKSESCFSYEFSFIALKCDVSLGVTSFLVYRIGFFSTALRFLVEMLSKGKSRRGKARLL